MIPASAIGAFASAIASGNSSAPSTVRPSSNRKLSPFLNRRTTTRSRTFCKSNACSGCPHSFITKLVMSTTLLIGRDPVASNRLAIQGDDFPTLTPLITWHVYRVHAARSIIFTGITASLNEAGCGASGNTSFKPNNAANSRAIPISPKQSGRFGYTFMCTNASPIAITSGKLLPSTASS